MFLKDTTIDVNWLLPHTNYVYVHSEFDIKVVDPDGSTVYLEGAINEEDFIAPTPVTKGAVTYKFTPDKVGVWLVTLSTGDSNKNEIRAEYNLRVSVPDTHVHQQIRLGR